MNRWVLAVAGCSFGLLLMQGAMAKVITMGTISRAAIQQACQNFGGTEFGMESDSSQYGCKTNHGTVVCTPDSGCAGLVGDLTPMTGSSAEVVLGGPRPTGAARLAPLDPRVGSSKVP